MGPMHRLPRSSPSSACERDRSVWDLSREMDAHLRSGRTTVRLAWADSWPDRESQEFTMASWPVAATNPKIIQRARSRGMPLALALLVVSVFISYIDRGNLSIAAPLLKTELGLSASRLGVLLSSFFWGYTICLFGWG